MTRQAAADAVVMRMPADAALAVVTMDRQQKRDQIASRVGRDGWAAFEAPLPQYFYGTARRWPGLVVDVGANTGFYTLLALAASAHNRVLACEPLADIRAALARNLADNGVQRRVRIEACAVGARHGDAPLYIPETKLDVIETSASLREDFKPVHRAVTTVPVRTLDALLRWRLSVGSRAVRVLKIDVEGAEAEVLAGSARTVARHRPVIFVEILPRADLAVLNAFLAANAYADVVLAADAPPMVANVAAFHRAAWNHAFVPRERVPDFLAMADWPPTGPA